MKFNHTTFMEYGLAFAICYYIEFEKSNKLNHVQFFMNKISWENRNLPSELFQMLENINLIVINTEM